MSTKILLRADSANTISLPRPLSGTVNPSDFRIVFYLKTEPAPGRIVKEIDSVVAVSLDFNVVTFDISLAQSRYIARNAARTDCFFNDPDVDGNGVGYGLLYIYRPTGDEVSAPTTGNVKFVGQVPDSACGGEDPVDPGPEPDPGGGTGAGPDDDPYGTGESDTLVAPPVPPDETCLPDPFEAPEPTVPRPCGGGGVGGSGEGGFANPTSS